MKMNKNTAEYFGNFLREESKTAEELNKQLDIPYDKLMQELSGLLKLDVIAKEGYPTKYNLKENISQEVKRRKRISEDDSFKLRINAFTLPNVK